MNRLFMVFFVAMPFMATAQVNKDSLSAAAGVKNRNLQFDSIDLKIIQRADVLLSDTSKWSKKDDRICEDDIANGRYSLFCALYKASVDIAGSYEHRRAGMQQVRFILEKYENGRVINHRLMDWNNHPDTKFEEVKKVLKESLIAVESQLKQFINR